MRSIMSERLPASLLFEAQYVFNVPTSYLSLMRHISRFARLKKWLWLRSYPLAFRPNVFHVRWTDPRDIARASLPEVPFEDVLALMGKAQGGDWDRSFAKLEELPHWQELHERLSDELSPAEREGRWAESRKLLREIRRAGYKSQEELTGYPTEDEILVDVDRDGRLLLVHGRTRLMIARMLGLGQVPVLVRRRHREWLKFLAHVSYLAEREGGHGRQGYLYHKFPHPDTAHYPAHHTDERWQLIKPHIPSGISTVLDIGAHMGQLSWELAHRSLKVTAIEVDPEVFYLLRKLGASCELGFEAIRANVMHLPSLSYDCVFALNVFHHYLKTKERFETLQKLLKRMQTPYLFFEAQAADESQMAGAYSTLCEREFAEWIAEKGGFTSVKLLGMEEKRPVFLLAK